MELSNHPHVIANRTVIDSDSLKERFQYFTSLFVCLLS
jgi:hypothetical protein